jgi:hypothetical protein
VEKTKLVKFSQASVLTGDINFDSLVLMVNPSEEGELMSIACIDKEWIVSFAHPNGSNVRFSWVDFCRSKYSATHLCILWAECYDKVI